MRLPKLEDKKSGRWVGCEDDLDRGDDETREGEQREDPEIETLKLGVPMEEVLGGIIDLYLQLRMDGYMVHTIHSDQGREFVNKPKLGCVLEAFYKAQHQDRLQKEMVQQKGWLEKLNPWFDELFMQPKWRSSGGQWR